jgi:uncharacterized membrane protein
MDADRSNPSRWSHRLLVIALSLLGCVIAMYLALYQWHVFDRVFEPFFGNGSTKVLRESALARFLPIPDAFLGALAYAAEAITAGIGDRERWRTWPSIVLLFGAVSLGLALGGITLAIVQATVVRDFCTLCLCSAAVSVVLAILAAPEVIAAVRHWSSNRAYETAR